MVLADKFCIDKYEWPNKKGTKPSIAISALPSRMTRAKVPMDAKTLCNSVGKRLCMRQEWSSACSGPKKTTYTWGNEKPKRMKNGKVIKQVCNFDKYFRVVDEEKVFRRDPEELKRLDQSEPSGHRKNCKSVYGAFDMNGNVEEWVKVSDKKMCLAGGHSSRLKSCRSMLCGHDPRWHYYSTGFRCCKDASGSD